MRTAVVLGTRPEIIKLSPVIRGLKEAGSDFFVLHTGQHYSRNMDRVFFENLKLDPPALNLRAGSGSHAEETGKMLVGIEKALLQEKATGVLVEGDTNTVLAGALAAAKLHLRVGHVEAGLRSGDMRMPEEVNRIVADHISDALFAPTENSKKNLLREGIGTSRISVTGNTIVDAVKQNLEIAKRSGGESRPKEKTGYILATIHRQENVDDGKVLADIVKGLGLAAARLGMTVLYPAHPRAKKALHRYRVRVDPKLIQITDPVDYLNFLRLESGARLILTDSGGVQEEACILGVPCVTLRNNTERPETIEVGANVLAGTVPKVIVANARMMLERKRSWRNPFGDGKAGTRIAKAWTAS
ncbi:MAG: UDP-N-acetylglucosamine 2-epimerase (non-hydrolyzing) [Thaumarchaeota archaeon]|nr:UDP-N-acetylglucosamine 2-epimerase (non-hydrolyzing) [Nitrososphaerota archaeon]